MRVLNSQRYPIFLCTIILLGFQLSLTLNSTLDASAISDLSSFPNERILETTNIISECDGPVDCFTEAPFLNQTSSIVSLAFFGPNSGILIQMHVGKPKTTLQMTLSSNVTVPMETTFELSLRDSSQDVSVPFLNGANWQSSLSFGSSTYSSRDLIIRIKNKSPSERTTSTLTITVGDDQATTTTTTRSNIGSAVGGAIGGFIVVIIIVLCIRRRRLRRLMKRRRAQASYQAENIQQFPEQQPRQPGSFDAQLQGSIMYQPLPPNSPNSSMRQPGNIHVVADPNFQHQRSIQYAPVANHSQPDYQGQGIQLAPPIQMVMPVNPKEGPLSELNFNHRFPKAPFQNFSSSFPQKTCSICLEDMKRGQGCRQLYCEHIFHGECARDWLLNQMVKQNHGNCPNCNKNMTFFMERKAIK